MKRVTSPTWDNWQKELESIGFVFHSLDTDYWTSSHHYVFSSNEIDRIDIATNNLYELCISLVEEVITSNNFEPFDLSMESVSLIKESWNNDHLSLMGRFDLAMNSSGQIKMLEFNADTPTVLLESSVAQWKWMKAVFSAEDQFNSIHEKLISRWKSMNFGDETLYFSCMREAIEDICQTEYLRDTAIQAGLKTEFIFLDEIGFDSSVKNFVDLDSNKMKFLFKLYPWEWLGKESFYRHLRGNLRMIEPAWKMLLSNKAILPLLWKKNPSHPNLLPAFFSLDEAKQFSNSNANSENQWIEKPTLSREGNNVRLIKNSEVVLETDGSYGENKMIYQEFFEIPKFDAWTPIIGSWIIGEESAGIGIREDKSIITNQLSHFVPHIFTKEG